MRSVMLVHSFKKCLLALWLFFGITWAMAFDRAAPLPTVAIPQQLHAAHHQGVLSDSLCLENFLEDEQEEADESLKLGFSQDYTIRCQNLCGSSSEFRPAPFCEYIPSYRLHLFYCVFLI